MAIYIDSGGALHQDQAANFALACPQCRVFAHVTPVSVPRFEALSAHRPSAVGIVYRCDACNAPIFLRYWVKLYGSHRVELSPAFEALERVPESFDYTFLPDPVDRLCREAIRCFSSHAYLAFSVLCRLMAEAVFHDLGEHGKLRMFDQLNDVRELAEIDTETFSAIRRILVGQEPAGALPPVDAATAGVLLEVVKDLLHENYGRRAQLKEAIRARRQSTPSGPPGPGATVTPIGRSA